MEKVVRKHYTEPCTPELLEEIAADKAGEFKDVAEAYYHQVYPNILLGGESIALDKYVLQDLGVTHVVNCAQGSGPEDVNIDARYYKGTKIKQTVIRAKDDTDSRIIPFFQVTTAYIKQALKSGGKVLVHCRTGVSLSATIVVAFIMTHEQLDARDALRYVRSRRSVSPNEGFRKQLCELNEQIEITPVDIDVKEEEMPPVDIDVKEEEITPIDIDVKEEEITPIDNDVKEEG